MFFGMTVSTREARFPGKFFDLLDDRAPVEREVRPKRSTKFNDRWMAGR